MEVNSKFGGNNYFGVMGLSAIIKTLISEREGKKRRTMSQVKSPEMLENNGL